MSRIISYLYVRARTASSTTGLLQLGHISVPCILGRTGLTARKREGDGGTPRGRFRLLVLFRRNDRERRLPARLRQVSIQASHGWCDDPSHAMYNHQVRLPFAGSHERLFRDDTAYDLLVVLDYNLRPRCKGSGSAIFFHVMRPGAMVTEGCIAVSAKHMRMILQWVGKRTQMVIGEGAIRR